MTDSGWYFEPYGSMGGANASAYRNTLSGAGLELEDLIAREAVQNSVDATDDDASETVQVSFSRRSLSGTDKDDFLSSIHLDHQNETPLERPGILSTDRKEVELEDALGGPLDLFLIEDFHTVGLGGTASGSEQSTSRDNYVRLCLNLGDTKKGVGQGGTYGYGKSVYWAASSLWTVIAYSTFEPTDRSDSVSARLVGVSWFKDHDFGDARFTGRAWFGDRGDPEIPLLPFVDADAHAWAEKLGFNLRDESQRGTSLMLLGAPLEPDALVRGVENWWWPRLLDGDLRVDVDGGDPPDPRDRVDLDRFVRAWDLLRDREEPGDNDLRKRLSYKGTSLGDVAVTCESEDEDGQDRVRIALLRDPRMVVEYLDGPYIRYGHPISDGVFKAKAAMNDVLAKSEPPGHDMWDHKTTRRDRPLDEDERKNIGKIYSKVKSAAREFIKELREEPAEPDDRCRELERELGKYLGVEGGTRPGPGRGPSPFTVRFANQPHRVEENGATVIDAKLEISLSESADEETRERLVEISAWLETVLDHGGIGDSYPVAHLHAEDDTEEVEVGTDEGSKKSLVYLLREDAVIEVDVRSAPLPDDEYRARLVVNVEEV